MLDSLIFLTLTCFIPLKHTYDALKGERDPVTLKMWAVYWCFYSVLQLATWAFPFIMFSPFDFVFMIVLLWMYHPQYRGALWINHILRGQLQKREVKTKLDQSAALRTLLGFFQTVTKEKQN